MRLIETLKSRTALAVGAAMRNALNELFPIGRASLSIKQQRVRRKGEVYVLEDVGPEEKVWNLITNAGRDYLHLQGYGTTGLGTNGLNYIALSNDTVTETATSTALSNEITLNGLGRAQGTYAHTAGTNTTTISRVFTASGTQSAQKAALFTASSAGTMNHVLGFTQRSLISGDTLSLTFTITLG
jgi:hypothetical protein